MCKVNTVNNKGVKLKTPQDQQHINTLFDPSTPSKTLKSVHIIHKTY